MYVAFYLYMPIAAVTFYAGIYFIAQQIFEASILSANLPRFICSVRKGNPTPNYFLVKAKKTAAFSTL